MPSFEEAVLGKQVRALRESALWDGEVIAISDGPAVLIELPTGLRVMVPRDGTTFEVKHPSRPPTVIEPRES